MVIFLMLAQLTLAGFDLMGIVSMMHDKKVTDT